MNENRPACVNVLFPGLAWVLVNIHLGASVDIGKIAFLYCFSQWKAPYRVLKATIVSNSHLKWLLELEIAPICLLLSPTSV